MAGDLERLWIGPSGRRLEGVLHAAATARGGVVVCHPHPLYGGNMENAVVVAVCDAVQDAGWTALRFNFGGVGASGGSYGGGDAETGDVRAAVETLAARLDGLPIALAGYSFGAWVGLRAVAAGAPVAAMVAIAPPLDLLDHPLPGPGGQPLTVVVGAQDQYCGASRLERLAAQARVVTVPDADHFLHGHEARVATHVALALGG